MDQLNCKKYANCYFLLVTCYLLIATCYFLLATCFAYLLLATYDLLHSIFSLLFATFYLLPSSWYLPLATTYLLLNTCYLLLLNTCYLLLVNCFFLLATCYFRTAYRKKEGGGVATDVTLLCRGRRALTTQESYVALTYRRPSSLILKIVKWFKFFRNYKMLKISQKLSFVTWRSAVALQLLAEASNPNPQRTKQFNNFILSTFYSGPSVCCITKGIK